jgi:hypothetical protein
VRVLLATAVALALATAAAAAPPRDGELVPGRSLAGVSLGMTRAQVQAEWGAKHGVCRDCARTTWYFNRRPFEPAGAGVELRGGRVAAVFTLWKPGWHTREGLAIGETAARVTEVYGPLTRAECGTYYALTMPRGRTVTVFYVWDDVLWGFGLTRAGVAPCR